MEIPANKPLTSRLLGGLGAEDLTAILRAAKEQRFSAHSVVVNQAAAAKHLFLLTHDGRGRQPAPQHAPTRQPAGVKEHVGV